jgi:uncharacterized protein (DUF2147 family)
MTPSITYRYVVAALVAAATFLVSTSHADVAQERRILGHWLTQSKDGVIQIYLAESGRYEGRIVNGQGGPERRDAKNPDPALRTRLLKDKVILQGFRYAGDGRWTDGTIYDPNNGKTYKCHMELTKSDTLNMRGYVGVPLFSRTEVWTRQK